MADKEIKISVIVDSDGAVKQLKQLGDQTEQAGDTAKRSSEGFSKFQATIVTVNQAVTLAQTAFSTLRSVSSTLFDTLNQATVIEGLSRSFTNLQSSIGVLGDEKIANLQTATKGLISDFNLMQQANQAVLLGVDKGTGEFEELSAAALKLGAATGRTATEALGDLITGLGRASPLILDNLGITVKAAEAQQLYADKLGVAVSQLTEADKAEAFRAVAIDKIRQKSQELAEVQETAGIAAQRLETTFDNLFAEVATGISENEDLADAINDLGDAFAEVDAKQLAKDLADFAKVVIDVTRTVVGFVNTTIQGFSVLKQEISGQRIFGQFGDEAVTAFKNIEDGLRVLKPEASNVKLLREEFNKLRESFIDVAGNNAATPGAVQLAKEKIESLGKQIAIFQKGMIEAQKPVKEFAEVLSGTGGNSGEGVDKAAEDFAKALDKIKESIDGVTGFDGAPQLTAEIESILEALNREELSADAASQALKNLAESHGTNVDKLAEFASSLDIAKGKLKDTKDEASDFSKTLEQLDFSSSLGDTFDDVFGGGGDLFSGLLTGKGGIGGTLGQLLGGEGGLLGALGLTGSTAGLVGTVVAAVASGINEAFKATERDDFAKLSDEDRATVFQTGLAQGIGAFFGIAPGSSIDKIREDIDSTIASLDIGPFSLDPARQDFNVLDALGVFGSKDPGTAERQAIDDFFRELFDGERLSLVIAGELEDVTDLTVSEYTGFFDELNTATEEGLNQFQGFEGIGLALNEILGLEAIGDEQIGAILGNNLETLNNLQIFLQEAGVSASQLGEALEEAFLNGDISAKQFLTSSQQIENIYAQGIPDAVGAVSTAFDNLLESAGQGRLALDALGDLGVEAIERGITSLDELREELLASGQSAEEVEALFNAIAQAGITSLEDLQNISLEKVAQIVSILEDSGIDLGLGDAQEQLDDITRKLDELPERIRTTVEIDVETNARDRGAEQVIESGALGEGLRNA